MVYINRSLPNNTFCRKAERSS